MARTPTLPGEMVTLRPVGPQDGEGTWALYSDGEARRMTGVTARWTRADVEDWCAVVADLPDQHAWAVTAGGREEMLGVVYLDELDPEARSCQMRIGLRSGQRGRGYAREATMLATRWALGDDGEGLGLHRLGLHVLSINKRGLALYESLGFVTEGRLRDAHLDGERYCDVVVMSMLEDELEHASADWR